MPPRALVIGFASLVLLAPATASAHFHVDYPDASDYPGPSPVPWWHEDAFGSPQKLGPCGDEDDATDGGGGPTGVVNTFTAGETITLQWTEVISHAGWFRIAIAPNRADFVDPPIVVDANGNSADAGIENPPTLPVIADGIYRHPMGGLKTWPPYSVTLPTTPCAKCTIQIIQVMLDHPSNLGNLPDGAPNPDGFLYHHCIDVSIVAPGGGTGGGGGDAGSSGGGVAEDGSAPTGGSGSATSTPDAGAAGNGAASPAPSGGCSCMAGTAPASGGLLSILGLAALARRRRARRSS
jgi:MYXO-CTERM domain-containing protein